MRLLKSVIIVVAILVVMNLSNAAYALPPVSFDSAFVLGDESKYKTTLQMVKIWNIWRVNIYAGIGAGAWQTEGCFLFFPCTWNWQTYPVWALKFLLPITGTGSDLQVSASSLLSAAVNHRGKILPKFERVDIFAAGGVIYRLSHRMSMKIEIGFPIGWAKFNAMLSLGGEFRF